jgi:hypothetical protein
LNTVILIFRCIYNKGTRARVPFLSRSLFSLNSFPA